VVPREHDPGTGKEHAGIKLISPLQCGDIFEPYIEKWENAPDVAGCRIPPLIKLTLWKDHFVH
jgi:hypothetical protein